MGWWAQAGLGCGLGMSGRGEEEDDGDDEDEWPRAEWQGHAGELTVEAGQARVPVSSLLCSQRREGRVGELSEAGLAPDGHSGSRWSSDAWPGDACDAVKGWTRAFWGPARDCACCR